MTTSEESGQRVVRPWIAALLTFVAAGMGFYYARQTKAAWFWAFFGVLLGIALAFGLLAYAYFVRPTIYAEFQQPGVTLLGMALTIPIAIIAWIAAARQQRVASAGPGRLFGYFLIWFVPFALSLVLAMALRFTVVQPFRMPSGSMQPTIQIGEYFLANKSAYGYSRYSFAPLDGLLPAGRIRAHQPVRGDLVVFRPVPEPTRDFVKRVVGVPGDRVQMIDGVLHINGVAVQREPLGELAVGDTGEMVQAYRETLPDGPSYTILERQGDSGELDNTRVFVVPVNHYFVMGDDRDNSADSRVRSVVGFVPFDNLVGRVDHIFRDPAPAP